MENSRKRTYHNLAVKRVLKVQRVNGRAFAQTASENGRLSWEEIPVEEGDRHQKRLAHEGASFQILDILHAPPVRPVLRIVENGRFEYGSALCYKGLGPDGQHEYWHIPSGEVLVEDEGYAERQMRDTLAILKRWVARRRLETVA